MKRTYRWGCWRVQFYVNLHLTIVHFVFVTVKLADCPAMSIQKTLLYLYADIEIPMWISWVGRSTTVTPACVNICQMTIYTYLNLHLTFVFHFTEENSPLRLIDDPNMELLGSWGRPITLYWLPAPGIPVCNQFKIHFQNQDNWLPLK